MKRCELCRLRATSYCEAHWAYLCWDCDAKVHGANFLVARHARCLLCRACQSLTPWRASGFACLGHASSHCPACAPTDKTQENGGASKEVLALPFGGTDLGPPPPCSDEASSSSSSSSSSSCASFVGDACGRREKLFRLGSSSSCYCTCPPRQEGNNGSSTRGLKPSKGEQPVREERATARNIDSSLKRRKKKGHPGDRTE